MIRCSFCQLQVGEAHIELAAHLQCSYDNKIQAGCRHNDEMKLKELYYNGKYQLQLVATCNWMKWY